MPTDRWYTEAENQIYTDQLRWIEARCGKDAAKKANLGWGVDQGDDYVQVSTKVYGHGILTSTRYHHDTTIHHNWEEF